MRIWEILVSGVTLGSSMTPCGLYTSCSWNQHECPPSYPCPWIHRNKWGIGIKLINLSHTTAGDKCCCIGLNNFLHFPKAYAEIQCPLWSDAFDFPWIFIKIDVDSAPISLICSFPSKVSHLYGQEVKERPVKHSPVESHKCGKILPAITPEQPN